MSSTIDKRNEHLETLSEIRSLMEKSSRFISLSGMSGILAGIFALMGAAAVYVYLGLTPFSNMRSYYVEMPYAAKWGMDYRTFFILDAALVLAASLTACTILTTRKARKNGQKIFDNLTYRLIYNLALPLAVGGIFCIALLYHGQFGMIAPAMLLFYGLALVNASKYTFKDIHYLGLCEIVLGLMAIFFIGYGLEFWAIGFGILHILYGSIMYFKYGG